MEVTEFYVCIGDFTTSLTTYIELHDFVYDYIYDNDFSSNFTYDYMQGRIEVILLEGEKCKFCQLKNKILPT